MYLKDLNKIKPIPLPGKCNYIAAFLTFACNLRCNYCINLFEKKIIKRKIISGKEWVEGLNRIIPREDLPVTLQGGEPSLHPDFIYIINHLRPDLNIDILTNLQFDIDEFIRKVNPERIKRNALYASIRVSYHPEQMDLDKTIERALKMLNAGFSVGIWGVMHPDYQKMVRLAQKKCADLGIDFRIKEFLGEYGKTLHGTYRYEDACGKKFRRKVLCRTTEMLVDSQGNIYRCHADLYAGINPIGQILDPHFQFAQDFKECVNFGHCNPCDVKVKTNRFQKYGHTSVEIKLIRNKTKKCVRPNSSPGFL